jgi:hypothetical protein
MEFMMVSETQDEVSDQTEVSVTLERGDGRTVHLKEWFATPLREKISVRLLKQTASLQQFEILNPFPAAFSFPFNGRTREVRPNTKYSLIRQASTEPLSLTVTEAGWEEFPLVVETLSIDMDTPVISLQFDPEGWRVGVPQLVIADPPAHPLASVESDWIITAGDIIGKEHIFIPKRPGLLQFPPFQVRQQACGTRPDAAHVISMDFPALIPL